MSEEFLDSTMRVTARARECAYFFVCVPTYMEEDLNMVHELERVLP